MNETHTMVSDQEWDAGDVHEAVFAPLQELISNFVNAGGKIYVCSRCLKKRNLDGSNLISGAARVGGAKRVAFMGDASLSNQGAA